MKFNNILTNYIVVSPVKDEQSYIEDTIKSVIGQTINPSMWIIVDDGSTDDTFMKIVQVHFGLVTSTVVSINLIGEQQGLRIIEWNQIIPTA